MLHRHHLTESDQDFLNQDRTDPITGEKIELGHTIVICAACKSAFFIESWEYLGYSHCEQSDTLTELPKPLNLALKAPPPTYLDFGFSKKKTFIKSESARAMATFFLFTTPFLFAFVGVWINFFIGFLAFCGVGLASMFFLLDSYGSFKIQNQTIKQIQNYKADFGITLDLKRQSISFRSRKRKTTFEVPFDQIEELQYHISYHPTKELSSSVFCLLSVKITTTSNTKRYFSTLHRDNIPEWSDFISKLPPNMRIINLPL